MQRRSYYFTLLISIISNGLFNTINVEADTSNFWNLPVPFQGAVPKTIAAPYISLKPEECGQCHVKQYQEWHQSFHAKATGPGLLGQLSLFDETTVRDCLNCHAPRSEQQNILLEGKNDLVHGVDCASCHIRTHQRYSSRNVDTTPHGSVISEPLFNKSEFCESCHQFGEDGITVNGAPLENTMEEWRASGYPAQEKTCQSCHMPEGAHLFSGIHDADLVRQGLSVLVQRTTLGLTITLINQSAGHALPTYITPRIRVLWQGDDGQNKTLTVLQRHMQWDTENGWIEQFDTRLHAHEQRIVKANLAENSTGWVEVWVDPDADYHDRVYPAILEAMTEDTANSNDINLIKQAYAEAAKSPYRLLRLRCGTGENHACW